MFVSISIITAIFLYSSLQVLLFPIFCCYLITKIDQVYLTLVSLALVILIFQAYVGLTIIKRQKVELSEKKKKNLKNINDIVAMGVLLILILILTYSTFS